MTEVVVFNRDRGVVKVFVPEESDDRAFTWVEDEYFVPVTTVRHVNGFEFIGNATPVECSWTFSDLLGSSYEELGGDDIKVEFARFLAGWHDWT